MKRIEVTDELLYQYMPIADELELDALEAEIADEEIVLSKKFEKKMKRLMWKEEHKWVAGLGKFMARAAVVFLGIIGVSLAVTMSVDAYRSKFFQTVQEIWEDSVIHTYDVGEEGQEFVPHEPSYIPEGYEEVRRDCVDGRLSIIYVNEQNKFICWDQVLVQEGRQYILDAEYEKYTSHQIGDGILQISYYEEGYVYAYYESKEYVYVLDADYLEVQDIYTMFESIE